MLARLITKSGDEIWYRTGIPYLSRHEIARIEFAKWERKQAHKSQTGK